MKQFNVPAFYRSPIIGRVKASRKNSDPRKKDFTPTLLDFGPVRFLLARHFGFCYGVENAIEISYRTIEENPGKRIFLLSEMIHNPHVNEDLQSRGVRFLMDTSGNELFPLKDLTPDDIVIVPAFGTTIELYKKLEYLGIPTEKYDTTCPFVEKVWKRAEELGQERFTVIVHGKPSHEETRATRSHSEQNAPTLVIKDMAEAQVLARVILGELDREYFEAFFHGRTSEGFDPSQDLQRLGVINQTTMLATETQAIADFLKETMVSKYGASAWKDHFADTRDTLCYATNDNQRATLGLLEVPADLAVVVGGYNSSNTSHLVELCEEKMPTYFISSSDKILSREAISHFDLHSHSETSSTDWLPRKDVVTIVLTSGASCPDNELEEVLQKLLSYFEGVKEVDQVLSGFDQ